MTPTPEALAKAQEWLEDAESEGFFSPKILTMLAALIAEARREGPSSCDVAGCDHASIRCGEHIRQQLVEEREACEQIVVELDCFAPEKVFDGQEAAVWGAAVSTFRSKVIASIRERAK